ncbi:MAG: iduronate sulfatase [Planctomycetaceae bacterium]|nr:iduronate sulfatase [Planctomycetaceae bacterium]
MNFSPLSGHTRTSKWNHHMRHLCRSVIFLCLSAGPALAADRPDVVMIAIDDLRPMLGCYGDPHIRTPNIDRLAARGVVFERAYCQYAKCGTSRLSLMTGLRPDSIGVFSNRDSDVKAFRKRRPDAVSMARWLKGQGYHTRSFGKIYHDGWDLATDWSVPSFPGREQEMLEILDEAHPDRPSKIAERLACPVKQSPDVPDDALFAGRMTNRVLAAMRDHDGEQPLFLAVGYRRPHLPFIAPKRYFDLYQPDESWLAKNPNPSVGAPLMAWFNSDGYVGSARKVGLTMPYPPDRKQAIAWNGYEMRSYLGAPNHGPIEQAMQLELLQAYAACVSFVDAQIGRVLDELQHTKRLEKTVVVLWSDHGWHLGEHSAWGKMTNFEIATRVPLIIAAPGVAPGRTRTLAELVDLYPTVCKLTNVDAPPHLAGESLTPALQHPARNHPSIAISQYARFREKYMGRALRTDRYRFVSWSETKTGRVVARELYDHESDPLETRNLADDPAQNKRILELETQLRGAFQEPK